MTESKTPAPDSHDKTPVLLAKTKEEGRSGAAGYGNAGAPKKPGSTLSIVLVVAVLLIIVLGGVVWFQHQTAQRIQAGLQQQVEQSSSMAQQTGRLAQQLQEQTVAQGAVLAQLQSTVQQLQDQLSGLDQAFQVLTDSGSDLILLNDIDHLVAIANQQITLGGNVANAIVALETAQARLSRANRPALASIQQTLNGDLDRLRAASVVDVAAVSVQLEQLNGVLMQAPLLVPDDAVPGVSRGSSAEPAVDTTVSFQADPEAPWWRNGLDAGAHWAGQAWGMLRHDLAGFISVRRVDEHSALLISPDQAGQLRLTLRLRVMTAQLALMMRQADVWKTELDAINVALQSHFDAQSPVTQRAIRLVTRLVDTPVDTRLPALTQTMAALEAVRNESSSALEQRRGSSSVAPGPEQDDASSPPSPGQAAPVSDDVPPETPTGGVLSEDPLPPAAAPGSSATLSSERAAGSLTFSAQG